MSDASGWDGGGSTNNNQGSNGQGNIVVVSVGDLYSWRGLRRGTTSTLSRNGM